jgi:hypothetical protein
VAAIAGALLVTFEPTVEVIKWSLAAANTQQNKPLVLLQPSPPIAAPQGVYRYSATRSAASGNYARCCPIRAVRPTSTPWPSSCSTQGCTQYLVDDFRGKLWMITRSWEIERREVRSTTLRLHVNDFQPR